MAAQFLKTTPILRMFDVRKAREFYLDFLGFQVDFEHRFEPSLPLYMQVSLGSVILHLSEHHGDCSPGAKVIIETAGLKDYHADILAKGYGYMRPGLEKQPWGDVAMTVIDPFTNRLVFSERGTDTTPV
jgi:uncharacterized glyoxalase superfamily protein PhnB